MLHYTVLRFNEISIYNGRQCESLLKHSRGNIRKMSTIFTMQSHVNSRSCDIGKMISPAYAM